MKANRLTLAIAVAGLLSLAAPALAFNAGGGSNANVKGPEVSSCANAPQKVANGFDRAYFGGSNALAEQQPAAPENHIRHQAKLDQWLPGGSNALGGTPGILACAAPVHQSALRKIM